MSNKTLEDLAQQVIDSQSGLMSVDDLKVFFEDTPAATVQPNQTPVEPVIAPAPQASTVTPAHIAEPVVSQPDVLGFVPEKFRGVDANASVEKLAKSYSELEAELRKEREERANVDRMLQNFTTSPQEPAGTPGIEPPEVAEEVDDSTFFDKPTESSKKVASQVAGAMLMAYHTALTEATRRTQFVESFKATHPDFDSYREDLAAILRARPDLDKKVENLPFVFEMAKARRKSRLEQMRKELGVPNEPSTPAVPSTPSNPNMTETDLIEKAKAAIIAEINRRKAATGITGGVPPTSPAARVQQIATQVPLSPEDALFEEMRTSGPKRLDLNI